MFLSRDLSPNYNWIPIYRGKVLGGQWSSLAMIPIDISGRKCSVFEVSRRFALGGLHHLLKMADPYLNQVQSAAWSLQWISQMCHWLRPFIAALYDSARNQTGFKKECRRSSTPN